MAGESPKFTFISKALPEDTFTVARFHGEEGLSRLYRFEILLVSRRADLDLEDVLAAPATLNISGEAGDIPFHGILVGFEQMHEVNGWVFYKAQLAPKLWWLTLTFHNQIFLDKTLPQIIEAVLKDGGLNAGLDFELRLAGSYEPREYVCQYQESHFNFVSRWMERDGLCYFFDQSTGTDKLVITDTSMAHQPMPQGATLIYAQPSGLDATKRSEVVKGLTCRQQPLPGKVLLKDYNYLKPDLSMQAEAQVSSKGRGEIYIYGEHFRTLEEGGKLAEIRAQELLCRKRLYHGLSNAPYVRPGYTFTLTRHYSESFNDSYLTIETSHEGNQERYLQSGLGLSTSKASDTLFYRNTFTAIPAITQFRPERVTEKSRIHGTINARIDASGSGKYAELDEHGRYKVILPFDLSGRENGKASCRLRMMQPYGGADHGMHMPLHKGTEVLLSFIDGDPDRPVIAGTVPNPTTPSQVTDADQTTCKLTTSGGNHIHFEDMEGGQRIHLASPTASSFICIGAAPDKDEDSGGNGRGKKHRRAAKDHEQAESDHDRASEDHEQVESDHDQASEDHEQAETDHDQSSEDHEQAESDHDQASEDHEQVEENADEIADLKKESEAGTLVGVTLSTSKLMKVEAGIYSSLVLGNEFRSVVGGAEEVVVVFDNKTVLGAATDVNVGGKFEFCAAVHAEVEPKRFNLHLIKSHLHQEVDKLEGEVHTLRGQYTRLDGDVTALTGDVTRIDGSVNTMRGDVNRIDGSVNTMRGDVNRIDGSVNTMRGDVNRIDGSVNTMRGDVNRIDGSVNTLRGDVNRIDGSVNQLRADVNNIDTTVNIISVEQTTISATIILM